LLGPLRNTAAKKRTPPVALSMFSGVLLKLRMPFLAQPMLFHRLFVVTPKIRSGPDVSDAGLLEAGECPHAPQEQVALGELEQRAHDALVHQREVARVVGDSDIGE
jgi:hypothetical protein